MKKLAVLTILIMLALAVYPAMRVNGAASNGHAVGMTIDEFTTTDLDGTKADSSMFKDAKLTVINYWATWCPPCKREMPDFQKLHEHFSAAADDVRVIGVICEGNGCTPDTAKRYLDENGFTWRNLRSAPALDKAFNTSNSIPQTLVVDSSGKVLSHRVGAFASYDELLEYTESFLTSGGSGAGSEAEATEGAGSAASSCAWF